MKRLDHFTITSTSGDHRIELYHGDLTEMPAEHAVDVLVVSAYPDKYGASRGTLIESLEKVGVSVKDLAKDKYMDLREPFACWLSKELHRPNIPFKRILCFEPRIRSRSSEVVGEIFQSLIPFVYGKPYIASMAMPLVATGRQHLDIVDVMENLLEAAVNWFMLGLPVKVIKIVEFDELKAFEIKGAFSVLKRKYLNQKPLEQTQTAPKYKYDLFISYSHANVVEVTQIHEELLRHNPHLKVFIDRQNLDKGAAWQQELYEALDDCNQVLAVLSPAYLSSKVCKEEFNIALARHRETENVLVPMYLYSADLPTYMKLIQFMDVREFNKDKIEKASKTIAKSF